MRVSEQDVVIGTVRLIGVRIYVGGGRHCESRFVTR